jgi:hypothetical protein
LNLTGVAERTDKIFLGNDYLRHYSRLFEKYKESEINILEIGVAGGASLRTWRQYFTKATIIGIDIAPQCQKFAGDRMIIEIGSQTDESFLKAISEKYKPTIIIDDGSHISEHQIISLECLFPTLPEGGIYIIEDMFFQVNPVCADAFRGESPLLAIDYLLALARERSGWTLPDPSAARRRSLVGWQLDRLEFFNGCAALFKKKDTLSSHEIVRLSEAAMENARAEYVWDRLYDYAIRYPEHVDVAERAAKKAFQANGMELWYRSRMIRVRRSQGRLDAAIAEARQALDLAAGTPHQHELQATLDDLIANPT